ncbi:MAG: toprim domain-containing protein [Gammaproteobacteria bacterium]|nr:toprim domain-containing protein [Gammaproteobacteria bacterium]
MSGGDLLETCRNIPLDRVAAALGYRRDPADRARFRREGSLISINGEKFFDHLHGTGGGGAIDLVIHATGCRFPEALRFLGGREGWGRVATIPADRRRLRLPGPSPRAWPKVRDALVRQRALRTKVLEACHGRGLLYADDRLNAVFVCRNAGGRPTGAEILGTAPRASTKRFRGMAPGSRKARGGFWLPCDRNRPAIVILTESAVDAISARSLRIQGTREHGAVVASTAGITNSVPPWIEGWKPRRIVCAYDADSAGDGAADRLAVNDPRVIRLRPYGAKDWNEILLRAR